MSVFILISKFVIWRLSVDYNYLKMFTDFFFLMRKSTCVYRYMTKFSLNTLFSCKDFLRIISHSTGSPKIREDECSVSQCSASKHFIKYFVTSNHGLLIFQAGVMGYTLSRSLPLLSYKSHFRFYYLQYPLLLAFFFSVGILYSADSIKSYCSDLKI